MIRRKLRAVRQSAVPVVHPREVLKKFHLFQTILGIQGPRSKDFTPYSSGLPSTSLDIEDFSVAYLQSEVLSKYDDELSSESKEAMAWERFALAEEACRVTNERFRDLCKSKEYFTSSSVVSLLWTAQRKIQGLLGPFSWDTAAAHFGFGPGGSTRLPRSKGHKVYKYSGRPETTIGNVALATAAIMLKSPAWNGSLEFREDVGYCDIVPGNYVITVPKNYKTHRVIAKEPCMNMYIQKGLGALIRRALRRVGVNLDDQSKNQRLARVGSLSGLLATIDLSMASDTVSTELVRYLLPPDWLLALEQCRSLSGELPSGERVVYQKFSSMGNGFTFELESLIFWALCSSVIDHMGLKDRRLAVYGDDIIVPSASVARVIDVLSFCGFTVNDKKTHLKGPFRESCGKHYISGNDVTPFYVKRSVKSLHDLFLLHNNIYRWSARTALSERTLSGIFRCLEEIRELAPRKWRKPRIPDGVGDGAFVGSFDQCTPTLAFEFLERGFEGYSVKILASVAQIVEVDVTGRLVAALDDVVGPLNWRSHAELKCEAGGVSQPPRLREVMTLVPLFPTSDHFTSVSL